MTAVRSSIAARLKLLRARVEAACTENGRTPDAVELLAISKQQPVSSVQEAAAAGLTSFGESYAQELTAKMDELAADISLRWHFVGHLQSNKANIVVGRCALIQSIDSVAIIDKVVRIAARLGICQDILVEVNLSGETTKSGVEGTQALHLCEYAAGRDEVRLLGLMGIAPGWTRNAPSAARESFGRLRDLFEQLPDQNRHILSMGMSEDFIQAIAEGSTMVRLGSALFGRRSRPDTHLQTSSIG